MGVWEDTVQTGIPGNSVYHFERRTFTPFKDGRNAGVREECSQGDN